MPSVVTISQQQSSYSLVLSMKSWEVLPMMAYTGKLRQKGVPFSIFRPGIGKDSGFTNEVYERVGKSVIAVCERI